MKENNLPEQLPAKDWNVVIDYEGGTPLDLKLKIRSTQ